MPVGNVGPSSLFTFPLPPFPHISHHTDLTKTTTGKPQPDLSTTASTNIQAASTRASAYLSSWGAWASEKKKGWGSSRSASGTTPSASPMPSPAPSDIVRAEQFKRDKEGSMDFSRPISSARTVPAGVGAGHPGDGEVHQVDLSDDAHVSRNSDEVVGKESGHKRHSSLFFDAEKEEREKREAMEGHNSSKDKQDEEERARAVAEAVAGSEGREGWSDVKI